jgi:hypothetical protein
MACLWSLLSLLNLSVMSKFKHPRPPLICLLQSKLISYPTAHLPSHVVVAVRATPNTFQDSHSRDLCLQSRDSSCFTSSSFRKKLLLGKKLKYAVNTDLLRLRSCCGCMKQRSQGRDEPIKPLVIGNTYHSLEANFN